MCCVSDYSEEKGTAKHSGMPENHCNTGNIEVFHSLYNRYSSKRLQSSQRLFQTRILKSYRNLMHQKLFMSEIA